MITLGITTYNRKGLLIKTAQSLLASNEIEKYNIRIYDDKSTALTKSEIKEIFPTAKDIIVRENNLRADANIRKMYEDFLDTGDEIFVNADSDLLFRPDWISFLLNHFDHGDGVMSLYNSNHHPPESEFIIKNSPFLLKPHLGSAGTVFHRRVVELIVKKLKNESSLRFDWKWSDLLRSNSIRLLCSKNSYIQHIGIDGQNSNGLDRFDFGLNFYPGSHTNEVYLVDFFQELINGGLKNSLDAMEQVRNTKDFKLGSELLKYPRKIKRLFQWN